RVRIPVVAPKEVPVQVGDGVAEHLAVLLARVKGGRDRPRDREHVVEVLRALVVRQVEELGGGQVGDLAEHVSGGTRRTRIGMLERGADRAERASRLGHRRRAPSFAASYLALVAQSAWYSMPSDFISASFSPQAAFCFSSPRRSVIFSHSLAAESSASFG